MAQDSVGAEDRAGDPDQERADGGNRRLDLQVETVPQRRADPVELGRAAMRAFLLERQQTDR
ncbi:MAG: hypothetical protein WA445_24505, partial [Pseudolabrys sp.]